MNINIHNDWQLISAEELQKFIFIIQVKIWNIKQSFLVFTAWHYGTASAAEVLSDKPSYLSTA